MRNFNNSTLPEHEEFQLAKALLNQTVIANDFIPVTPTPQQAVFLTAPVREILYGGAAGGGKSAALLMAALQYVDTPGYSALLLRKSFTDLSLPGSLIPLSHEWLTQTAAHWDGIKNSWTFPSGSTVTFGYLATEQDKFRYQSAAFAFVGFDELTQFTESQYRYMFSRVRRNAGVAVPLRVRSASNPGNIGHEWVRRRFIDDFGSDRLFVPALLADNPHLDSEAYIQSLAVLDPVTRAQLRHGDWTIRPEGNLFKREWFDVVEQAPTMRRTARAWDLAATAETPGRDPDWTVGTKMGEADGTFYILGVERIRAAPGGVEKLVKQTAEIDGTDTAIVMEQEPGSSGKSMIDHYARGALLGWDFKGIPATGNKVTRSAPFSAACERRQVKLVRGRWIDAFLDELCAFPNVSHDDQVDAATNAFMALVQPAIHFETGLYVL